MQCNKHPTARQHKHHVVARYKGGSNEPSNIVLMCATCHVQLHQQAGDFATGGAIGGASTAARAHFVNNLRQFAHLTPAQRQRVRTRYIVWAIIRWWVVYGCFASNTQP